MPQDIAYLQAIPPALRQYNQFIIFRLAQSADGHIEKYPINPKKLHNGDAHDPVNQMPFDAALALVQKLGNNYQLGFVVTEDDPFWVIDLDKCVAPDGTLSDLAKSCIQAIPGCAIEYSVSGTGIHLFGCGRLPPHRTRPTKDSPFAGSIELYSKGRPMSITGRGWTGEIWADYTEYLLPIIDKLFYKDPRDAGPQDWTEEPEPGYTGPTEDKELVEAASKQRSMSAAMGTKASFADLWENNGEAIGRAFPEQGTKGRLYDASQADAALAQHLAYWTGKNCERIKRIMQQSGLYRDKWEHHRTYLEDTILKACARQVNYPGSRSQKTPKPELITVQEQQAAALAIVDAKELYDQIAAAGDREEMELLAAQIRYAQLTEVDRGILIDAWRERINLLMQSKLSRSEVRNHLTIRAENSAQQSELSWLDHWVFITTENKFYNLETGDRLGVDAFNYAHTPLCPVTDSGARTPAAVYAQARGIPCVSATMYAPHKADCKTFSLDESNPMSPIFANEFRPSTLPPGLDLSKWTQADIAAVQMVQMHLFITCSHRPEVYRHLVDWIAYCVQRPGDKITWAPLIQGEEGSGKTVIEHVLRCGLGVNVGVVSLQSATEPKYNGYAQGKCVQVFEELRMSGANRYAISDALKGPITNETVEIVVKGAMGKQYPNTVNYIAFTNYKDAAPLGEGSRRWMPIFSPIQHKDHLPVYYGPNPDAYFAELFRCIKQHAPAICGWLKSHEISKDFPAKGRAPWTPEFDQVVALTKPALASAIEGVVNDFGLIAAGTSQIIELLDPNDLENKVTNRRVKEILRDKLGWIEYGRERIEFLGYIHIMGRPGLSKADAAEQVRRLAKLSIKRE